jgi:hypothetical protein
MQLRKDTEDGTYSTSIDVPVVGYALGSVLRNASRSYLGVRDGIRSTSMAGVASATFV